MLYELTLYGRYQDQQCINRWTYNSGGTPASTSGSFALMSASGFIDTNPLGEFLNDSLAGRIQILVSQGFSFENVIARALYSVTDFYERPFPTPITGRAAGEQASPFLAYGFRSGRVRTDVGRGYKRFAGVVEGNMGAGGIIVAPAVAQMTDLAAEMSAVLEYVDEGQPVTFTPAVLSLQRYNPETGLPDPSGTARRPYPTLAEQLEHTALGVVWEGYDEVRSQISRQYGRGS